MYFVLGMLSIIGAIAIALIVWGVLKITKLLKAIRQQEEWIMNNDRNVWDGTQRLREDLERRQDNMERHVYQNVTELQREMDMKINDQITDAVTESHSYTDKRIDKLIDVYFNEMKQTEKKNK